MMPRWMRGWFYLARHQQTADWFRVNVAPYVATLTPAEAREFAPSLVPLPAPVHHSEVQAGAGGDHLNYAWGPPSRRVSPLDWVRLEEMESWNWAASFMAGWWR